MDNAPLHIGQPVVCNVTNPQTGLVKGRQHVIKGIKRCACGKWRVSIGTLYGLGLECAVCGTKHSEDLIAHLAAHFSPIEYEVVEDVRKELATLPVEERLDVVKTPVHAV